MKAQRFLSVVSVAAMILPSGCVPKDPSSQPTSGDTPATTAVTADTAIKEISGNWSQAEDWAPRVKGKYKQGPQFEKARDLYDNAKKENNAWLELLITHIKDGQKPDKSAEFKNQAKVAAKASQDFVDYARSVQASPAKPGVAAASVAVIADILVSSGFKIWTEYDKQKQTKRAQKADELRTRLKWPTWEKAGS